MLHLTLLGQFAAAIDGHAITHWPRKSALLLLQLLAIAPEHRITRNEAAQALAHETDDEQLRQVSRKNDYAFGFSMEFKDQAAYSAYNDHPAHVAFVRDRWVPEVAKFMEIDYVPLAGA